jgi:hypothetical protein
VSDSDPGGPLARSPYARPDPGTPAAGTPTAGMPIEPRGSVVESVPEVPDAPDDAGPATAFAAPIPAASAPTGWAAASAVDSVPSSGVVMPEGSAVLARPRPVQVAVARRGPRRARLVIKHIDPWTVLKISFVVSVVMLAVIVIAVAVIYGVLGRMGVWTQINTLVNEVSPTTTSSALHNPVSAGRVVGVAAVIGAINVVLLTALSTLGAAIYNLISDLVGGVEVTLTDP